MCEVQVRSAWPTRATRLTEAQCSELMLSAGVCVLHSFGTQLLFHLSFFGCEEIQLFGDVSVLGAHQASFWAGMPLTNTILSRIGGS